MFLDMSRLLIQTHCSSSPSSIIATLAASAPRCARRGLNSINRNFIKLPLKKINKTHNKGNPADRCAPGDFSVNPTSNTGVFPALTETVFVLPIVED
jgi:hypothetical protein